MSPAPNILPLAQIRLDGGTQVRTGLNEDVVQQYAEAMASGAVFPPVIVFHDGTTYWLADGFHRIASAKKATLKGVSVDIRQGGQRDALLWGIGSNTDHGLQRTNADKRRSVELMLTDPEWSTWSDRNLAIHCGVSQPFVSKMRAEIQSLSYNGYKIDSANDAQPQPTVNIQPPPPEPQPQTRMATRGGVTYPMKVENIGKKAEPPPAPEELPPPPEYDDPPEPPTEPVKPARPEKNGAEMFDLRSFNMHIGHALAEVAKLAKQYGCVDGLGRPSGRDFEGHRRMLAEIGSNVGKWHDGLKKMKGR